MSPLVFCLSGFDTCALHLVAATLFEVAPGTLASAEGMFVMERVAMRPTLSRGERPSVFGLAKECVLFAVSGAGLGADVAAGVCLSGEITVGGMCGSIGTAAPAAPGPGVSQVRAVVASSQRRYLPLPFLPFLDLPLPFAYPD